MVVTCSTSAQAKQDRADSMTATFISITLGKFILACTTMQLKPSTLLYLIMITTGILQQPRCHQLTERCFILMVHPWLQTPQALRQKVQQATGELAMIILAAGHPNPQAFILAVCWMMP